MEKIGPTLHKHTITVDLNAVRALASCIARDNEGLETSSGFVPDDLDNALEILCKGPAMNDFRHLLSKIIEIHREVHNEWVVNPE